METLIRRAIASSVAVAIAAPAVAQQCYSPQNQCFSFAPPGDTVERLDPGLVLRSEQLTVTGDVRVRSRFAETPGDAPYNENDQHTSRARIQLDFDVNDYINAFVEFNFSDVWAGAEGYSDAQPDPTVDGFASRENYNGVGQAYMQLEDAFDLGTTIRLGRSNYFLANGCVLGSCDFLQYPGAFTGAWIARGVELSEQSRLDFEVFGFDNYGPLQAQLPGGGERYVGGTTRFTASEDGILRTANVYHMVGTADGDVLRNEGHTWTGLELDGEIVDGVDWFVQLAHRHVPGAGDDVSAARGRVEYNVDSEDSFLRQLAYTFTDSEGALHVNPADFNTAGLLQQYGGIWRSDLQTNQVSAAVDFGAGYGATVTALTLDRRRESPQLGDFEVDVLLGKEFHSALHVGVGYGIDNDERQVGYLQVTTYF